MMNRSMISKIAAAGLAGTMALAVATPSFAGDGRAAAAAAGGFVAGAVVGSAVANSYYGPRYYGPGYAYQPGYAYDGYAYAPGYAYGPGYAYQPSYAYEPDYAYVPAPRYRYRGSGEVGSKQGSGAPIYWNQLGPNCTIGLKEQDRC